MQRSSPSIAALATALAKAQIELANPEKSLTGTIEGRGGERGARQFRYAPLSSGLEIVRKTLGQHRDSADHCDRSDGGYRQPHDRSCPLIRGVDRFRLAGLRDRRD